MLHLLQVHVREDQLLVGAVDDRGSVGAGEHVRDGAGPELAEHGGLGAQGHLLLVTEGARGSDDEVEQTPVPQGAEEVLGALELGREDGPGCDIWCYLRCYL